MKWNIPGIWKYNYLCLLKVWGRWNNRYLWDRIILEILDSLTNTHTNTLPFYFNKTRNTLKSSVNKRKEKIQRFFFGFNAIVPCIRFSTEWRWSDECKEIPFFLRLSNISKQWKKNEGFQIYCLLSSTIQL